MQNTERKKAMEFAQKAHANHMYDHFPYFKHLQDVVNVLIRFGYTDPDLLDAGWCHDTMEDAGKSYSDIKKELGIEVAEIVYCVTDEKGRNRKEKKEKTLPGIRANPDAIIIKLADRIANCEHSNVYAGDDKNFLDMYRKEYKLFRWALFVPGHAVEMWNTLDALMNYNP